MLKDFLIILFILLLFQLQCRVVGLKFYKFPNRGSKNPNIHCCQKGDSHGVVICNDIIYPYQLLLVGNTHARHKACKLGYVVILSYFHSF